MQIPKPTPGRQVLIVEDEPRMREILLRAVSDMGFDVSGARTAKEAAQAMATTPADILILDLNLPGQGGMDFLESIRATHPHVQAIFLTGFGDLTAAQRAIRLNAVDFLTKPTPLGDLEKSLERARRRAEEAAAPKPHPAMTEGPIATQPGAADAPSPVPRTLEDLEREHILAALDRHSGNRSATATELGISLRTLYYRLAEYQKQGFLVGDDGEKGGEPPKPER